MTNTEKWALVQERHRTADFHSLRKTLGTELAMAGVPIRIAMELLRHSDAKLTTKIYTDAGMPPIWDAVGALPMFNDTQIDIQKVVASSYEPGTTPSRAAALKSTTGEQF